MAPLKRKFDKKTSTTYALVHRPQNDPLIHDHEASSIVYKEIPTKNQTSRSLDQSASQSSLLDSQFDIRPNEGEAAMHGIFYDDTKYDYLQHLRDIGQDSQAEWIEAPVKSSKEKKGKEKQKLEDALREASIQDEASSSQSSGPRPLLLDEDVLPNVSLRTLTYQDQQDVPDAIAGFQPDMDPRLREVLEALDDEAYVEEDEDMFGQIAGDGEEIGEGLWEELGEGEDDQGWESDVTEKETSGKQIDKDFDPTSADIPMLDGPHAEADNSWLSNFREEKLPVPIPKRPAKPATDLSLGTSLMSGRRKKRKGALTSSAGYSMSSSALARTDGLQTLDARFDKIEEAYNEDDEDLEMPEDQSMFSGMTGASAVSEISRSSRLTVDSSTMPMREDFDTIMDDFLGSYSMQGKKRVKRSKNQTGMEQLDEIRKGLGPARLPPQRAS